ncbi:sigma 54 modulation/S30EA ribosomal C-terminal domain-containing protein [Actinoplanes utahensis]|uniref:sigma 54 modulation/S30EA ribosomal C-terminal domain-containing protein n=1 Tax=Actinoplanes utahensis TaxID=1869 RepID=UPI001378AE05|nr:sigma 54 modulation/S30EA ribosomal C-terminal domain-containing protein [Actinoplanes utahensis]
MTRERPTVTVVGAVTAEESAYARHAVGGVLSTVDHTVEHPRARLSPYGGHDDLPPVVVMQINVAVRERMVRVQTAAPSVREAADQTGAGLLQRLRRLDQHLAAERCGDVGFVPGEWCSPYPQNPVGLAGPRTAAGRIVRMKEFHLAVQTPDSAAFAMDLRDYPFHLFVDAGTGTDAIVYRDGPTGYSLHRSVPAPVPAGCTVPLTVQRWPAVPMPAVRAMQLLNAAPDRRFLFFTDPRSRRGRVLYRRFDGQFGLLTPVW